ncbi:MAG: phospholipase/carboxylesterase [Ignavibacteria bacterium]|nr:MAG: phospholipase/carboxylesterase [Ignavibacteria bacterium]KAF0156682.1 MAG: phospholipase/carboxylesterase [Ignavibacteria bacterium]
MKTNIKTITLIIAAVAFSLAGCTSSLVTKSETAKQVERSFSGKYEKEVALDYLLYLPKDYDAKEKLPLLLFLHGAGERGNNLEQVKAHGPAKLIEQGKDFPFIVVSPQCPANLRWNHEWLSALIDEIISKYKVDYNRIYVTGLSMGGNGTWRLATEISNRLAAVIPICGWGDSFAANLIGNLPIWTFHGAKDFVVPIKSTEDLVARIKSFNGNVKFTVYPDAGHDSWTETYNNPEIYEWLLKHTLDQREFKK